MAIAFNVQLLIIKVWLEPVTRQCLTHIFSFKLYSSSKVFFILILALQRAPYKGEHRIFLFVLCECCAVHSTRIEYSNKKTAMTTHWQTQTDEPWQASTALKFVRCVDNIGGGVDGGCWTYSRKNIHIHAYSHTRNSSFIINNNHNCQESSTPCKNISCLCLHSL